MSRQRKTRTRNPNYAMVVDGETEAWYLNMLKRNETNLQVTIKPEIPSKKTLEKQYQRVVELSEDYTRVFWIVDFDTLIAEGRQVARGAQSPVSRFQQLRQQLMEAFANVTVIVNNPCLEFWFLLHYERTDRYFRNCEEAATRLKRHIPDYEKSQKYFTHNGNDIYRRLRPLLQTAIKNASALGLFDPQESARSLCEMHLLYGGAELQAHFANGDMHSTT